MTRHYAAAVELSTTFAERALHFALFVSAAAVFGVVALAVLERIVDGDRRAVRLRHMAIPVVLFVVIGIAERLYHVFN